MRLLLLGFCWLLAVFAARADFLLRDGDTVVFLGDSITAARGYTKTVELYTLMRFPERRVRFFNAGAGGDTAAGSLKRLESDVFSLKPTVVIVAFGINDIGWGTKADDAHKKAYLDAIREIITRCKARGARPVICSAAVTDTTKPGEAEHDFLQTMCDEGLALAKSLGAETVDIQRGMREIQRRIIDAEKEAKDDKRTRLHAPDGVHPNDLGHLAMAYALLKGLGAPADVSAAEWDVAAPDGATFRNKGCQITNLVKRPDGGVEFTRLDEGLPLTMVGFEAWNSRWVPISDGVGRYQLTVKGLPPGEYEITAEGRSLGKEKAERLAAGVNVGPNSGNNLEPGGPWAAQCVAARNLVEARGGLAESGATRVRLLANSPQSAALAAGERQLDDGLIAQQRAVAKPYPYRFVVRPVK